MDEMRWGNNGENECIVGIYTLRPRVKGIFICGIFGFAIGIVFVCFIKQSAIGIARKTNALSCRTDPFKPGDEGLFKHGTKCLLRFEQSFIVRNIGNVEPKMKYSLSKCNKVLIVWSLCNKFILVTRFFIEVVV
jgi:hypothetical protein